MIKRLADFFRKPVVYRSLIFSLLLAFLYIEVIAPLVGSWSPKQPSLLDGWIMWGK